MDGGLTKWLGKGGLRGCEVFQTRLFGLLRTIAVLNCDFHARGSDIGAAWIQRVDQIEPIDRWEARGQRDDD